MNSGEKNELLLKLYLVHMRDIGISHKSIGIVNKVGFPPVKYGRLPADFDIKTIVSMNDQKLKILSSSLGISKSPAKSKSDVYINGEGYSVKSLASAPPAIVNHTARPGFETACRQTGVDIADLDELVDKYWELRRSGKIKEDVGSMHARSPFGNGRDILEPLLRYFLFIGTGSGPSEHRADYILDYTDPICSETWRVLSASDVIDEIWDKLVFSLRSKKGMPGGYPKNLDRSKNGSIARWTQYIQNEYRGALHIRVKQHGSAVPPTLPFNI